MSSQCPKVTVILPVYNAETTLKRAIDSVLNQTFQDFVLLIVDNNSTDSSFSISRKSALLDNRIRVFKEPEQGVVHAFNKGLANATTAYIARMDADDEMLPDRLQLQFDFLKKNTEYGAVAGLAEYIPHHDNTKGFKTYVGWSNSLLTFKDISLNRFVEMPVINPTAMWRKKISDIYGSYLDGDFPEDYEMWLRWLNMGVKVGKLKEIVLKWHDSDNRLTRTAERYSKEAFLRVRVKYLATYLKKHNPYHPEVWVWGAARQTRRDAELMEAEKIVISKYIDVAINKELNVPLIHYSEMPKAGKCFVLIFVKNPVARRKIESYLELLTYRKGLDYLPFGQ